MSFENGYKATAYIDKCMTRYKADPTVFLKVLQMLNVYSSQPEWPHNYIEFKQSAKEIIGDDLEWVIRFTGQYLYAVSQQKAPTPMRQVEWPDDLPNCFIGNLVSFFRTIYPVLDRADQARISPLKFYGVARSQTSASDIKIIKFIRMDGASLDIEMSKRDVEKLIRNLEIMIQDSCELK